jgi:O-antigen ligase/polysaccharide polymerase Wzy-like membrane protein
MHHPDLAQTAAVLGAAGCVLALQARNRLSLYAGLGLLAAAEASLAVALVSSHDLARLKTPLHVAAIVVGVLAVAGVAAAFVRWPALVPLAVLVAAPFRLQIGLGSLQEKFLLLPLYGVLAAAVLALVYRTARAGPIRPLTPVLAVPVAAFMAFDALSLLWAQDLEQGSVELAFFIFPFAVLVVIVARSPYASWLPRALGTAAIALGCVFAAIGIYQAWTHTLIYAHDLSVANAYTTYFRVTSLFKDPSIYGRQLVVSATLVLALMWARKLGFWWAAAISALLYTGLYFSYSQSSMVVLFAAALVVTVALADPPSRNVIVIAALLAALAAAAGFVASAKGNSWHKATSGRSHLISVTATVIKNHPLVGVGVGSQPLASQREARSKLVARKDASHTAPLTVLAELGVVGFLLYLGLLASAFVLLRRLVRGSRLLGVCLAAVFLVLLLHSLVYSGFFEDPLTWGVLAFAAASLAALGAAKVAPEVREQP